MRYVRTEDLKSGMRLAKPIFDKKGVLLYERDTVLGEQGIENIKNFELIGIYILEPAEPVSPMSEEEVEFERFQTVGVFELTDALTAFTQRESVRETETLANKIIKSFGNINHKIVFMQSLRSPEDQTKKHSLNVAILSAITGHQMKLNFKDMSDLIMAALMHDLGKNMAPYKLIVKGNDLDEEEQVSLRHFQQEGLRLIQQNYNLSSGVRIIISQLHKENDENEAEQVKKKRKILLGTKILRVCTQYDNMTSMKIGQEPMSDVAAIRYLLSHVNEYDVNIVSALVAGIKILNPGVCVDLTTGQKGLVIRENPSNVLRPVILGFDDNIMYDLGDDRVFEKIQIKDVMKTMDKRRPLNEVKLKRYKKQADKLLKQRKQRKKQS